MSAVRIERFLRHDGKKPFFVVGDPHHRIFPSLRDLKMCFEVKSIKKDGCGWAINGRGKRVEWTEYAAEIVEPTAVGGGK